ncbi:protein tyrosine phosphatase [Gordonibacter sp. An230]|uniref:tyrosine-protein phosphatase n=1 Tax=Gordonibacter sp. An230 TaxID=1965592 RepID=UPI000B39DC68|nr:tyrosine-protein phosphatase [Gordonibacter sp. An230]OUO86555.1 protein tyrosine phosphatase [Gordonibacter sp. An230]
MVDVSSDAISMPPVADAEGPEGAFGGRIALEGLPNTRDLGGIPASDGRIVAPGRLIRSGSLDRATERDLRTLLDDCRVRTVIDLRTEEERRERPDPEGAMTGVRFVSDPVLNTATLGITREGGFLGAFRALRALKKDPAGVMEGVYERLVLDEGSQRGYARFFDDVLAAGSKEGAVLWHCTVGKDRAGLATALLLHALGVSRDAVMADYLATNHYVASHAQGVADALAAHGLSRGLDESIRVLNSADPRFLEAAFAAAERVFGDLDAYLRDALRMTDDRRASLRDCYLARA